MEDDIIEDELNIGINFLQFKSKIKKELKQLSKITDQKEILDIIKNINNILEWYC